MFSKTADPTATPPRPTLGAGSSARSVLSADLKITGDVRSSGGVDLFGDVEGTIQAETLVVGTDGQMTGDISADTVDIKGRHAGQIVSKTLTLRASAQVSGDISYVTLVIESGAEVEGRFSRIKG